jgi:hypothetical protein
MRSLAPVGIGPVEELEFVHVKGSRRQRHLLPVAGEIIGALAVHLDGREGGRDLKDVAAKGRERLFDLGVRGATVALPKHLALGIVGRGLRAPAHGELVSLEGFGHEGQHLGRLAQRHRKEPGRGGVERAGMARLLRFHGPADLVDHGRRGNPRGLVHDQEPRDGASLAAAAHAILPLRKPRALVGVARGVKAGVGGGTRTRSAGRRVLIEKAHDGPHAHAPVVAA